MRAEIKQIPGKVYFCAEKELRIAEIAAFAADTIQALCEEAGAAGLLITGPVEFIYFNASADHNKPFDLVVGLPVEREMPYEGRFFFMESMPFSCACRDIQGGVESIGPAWCELAQEALDNHYRPSGQCREIYKVWVDPQATDNLTELQLGLALRKL